MLVRLLYVSRAVEKDSPRVIESILESSRSHNMGYGIPGVLCYGGGVFLPFADATSGRETYGAGRYLLDTIKGADLGAVPDGQAVLDFNFAYNPSCAYSNRYVCPLAPRGNRLPAPVRAGEQAPG